MRLVDADKLNKKKKYTFQVQGGAFPKADWFIKLDDLFRAPTVDAKPVVHAKWEHEQLENESLEAHTIGECSNCHKIRIVDNYCPNCGAMMDLND